MARKQVEKVVRRIRKGLVGIHGVFFLSIDVQSDNSSSSMETLVNEKITVKIADLGNGMFSSFQLKTSLTKSFFFSNLDRTPLHR